jgi:outer membrane protein TolC
MAEQDAEVAHHQYDQVMRDAAEKVRETYFELFYLKKTIGLLEQTREQLREIAQIAEARYRVGQSQQQDIIKAQLQMTAVLKDLAMHHQHMEQRQAELKAVIGRKADSADIEIAEVRPSDVKLDVGETDRMADSASPEIGMERAMEAKSAEALRLARKNYWPDFSVQYMYQHTGDGFPSYYMLSVGAKVPLYSWRKQTPAVEQSSLELESAAAHRQGRSLSIAADADNFLAEYMTTGRTLTIYRQGLLPQSRNSLDAAFAAYRVGKVDFQTLITAANDLLTTNQDYFRELADHEIALAKLEQIIGDLK